jgi:hypothetical protein
MHHNRHKSSCLPGTTHKNYFFQIGLFALTGSNGQASGFTSHA